MLSDLNNAAQKHAVQWTGEKIKHRQFPAEITPFHLGSPESKGDRERLILEHSIVVERILGKLMRAGQCPSVETADLQSIGNLEMIRTIDASPHLSGDALAGRIAANVQKVLIRNLKRGKRWSQRAVATANYEDIYHAGISLD